MLGQGTLKPVEITPVMVAKAVAGPRTKQLRARSGTTGSIDHELLSHMPASVPYDLGLLPAIAEARQEATRRGLIETESAGGVVRLLKLPALQDSSPAFNRRRGAYFRASKTRKAQYAGSGDQG